MKKIFALLFVCAGLTAMAAVPKVTTANVVNGKSAKSMVMKSNTLSNQLTAPVMKASKASNMSLPNFFAEKNITPNDNKLMKKAPRRVAADDVMATKIAFMLGYDYNSDSGKVLLDNDYLWGGWNVTMEQQGDNQFNAYLYFSGIPFVINVDYTAKTAEMETGNIYAMHWADTTKSGRTTTINDTIEYIFLVDEGYMTDDAAEDFTNLTGTLYEDGTIYFPTGWCLYFMDYTTKTVSGNGPTTTTRDTTGGRTGFFRSTYLMTANANHEFVSQSNGNTYNRSAYMFQYDDTTAISWNLWGMGNRGMEMYIHEDGTMEFPSYQVVYTEDIADYAAQYTQYNWDYAYEFYNFAIDLDQEADTAIDDSLSEGSKMGTVDANGVYWDATAIYDLIAYGSSFYFGLGFYPYLHNKLTFTNGDQFLLGKTATPEITYVVNDENVVVTAAPADELETQVVLYIYNPTDSTLTPVDNPYTVERTDADQTIIFAALAQATGKTVSEFAVVEVTIPAAEPSYLRGDVNMDGSVGIADVTALIDYILSKDATGISLLAADTNEDGSIGIADVTCLIDYILNKSW